MHWILILMLIGGGGRGGMATTATFTDEAGCQDAGKSAVESYKKLLQLPQSLAKAYATYTCVPDRHLKEDSK